MLQARPRRDADRRGKREAHYTYKARRLSPSSALSSAMNFAKRYGARRAISNSCKPANATCQGKKITAVRDSAAYQRRF